MITLLRTALVFLVALHMSCSASSDLGSVDLQHEDADLDDGGCGDKCGRDAGKQDSGSVDKPDAPSACPEDECALAGGSCMQMGGESICRIECNADRCACPVGARCHFTCATPDSCQLIDCAGSIGCEVECVLNGECRGSNITCGNGECELRCQTPWSCTDARLVCGTEDCVVSCGTPSCIGLTVECGVASSCDLICAADACSKLNLRCEDAGECTADCLAPGNTTCSEAALRCDDAAVCDLQCGGRETSCQ